MQLGEDLSVFENHTHTRTLTLFLGEKLQKREGLKTLFFKTRPKPMISLTVVKALDFQYQLLPVS